MLQLLGCDLLQGFEIGMPMALEELILFREQASASQMQKLAATGTAA
jgi:EAL domain-containing protein (putative c-di-GMP-specific phosphodiesterase class I)